MNITIVLQAAVTVLWIVVIGLIIVSAVRASRGQKIRGVSTTILVLAGIAILLTLVSAGLRFIKPEERGVVISALSPDGYRKNALTPGLHWIVPFFEDVITYPIFRQTYTMSATTSEGQIQGDDSITARTSDGQEIFLDASVIYQIDPAEVVNVHIEWQKRYEAELVRAQARGVIRDAVSQYRVDEVVSTKRFEMSETIKETLAKKLSDNGLELVEFVLRNITFSPEYAASVEQKQIAEQQAQQAKFVVEQRKQEAEQARQVAQGQADSAVINAKGQASSRLIQAEAESKALQLIADSLKNNQDLLTYNYINKLSPGIQVMLVPSNSPFLLPLPTMGPVAPSTSNIEVLPTPVPSPTPLPTPTATP